MRRMNGPQTTSTAGQTPRFEPWISLALVVVSAALALHHLSGDAATADEPVHLAAALEAVRDGTGRWNPEHPPLAKALAGIALTGLPIRPADDPLHSVPGPARLLRFLYQNATPPETILFRARLPFVALLAALLLAVRAAARPRGGPGAGGAPGAPPAALAAFAAPRPSGAAGGAGGRGAPPSLSPRSSRPSTPTRAWCTPTWP